MVIMGSIIACGCLGMIIMMIAMPQNMASTCQLIEGPRHAPLVNLPCYGQLTPVKQVPTDQCQITMSEAQVDHYPGTGTLSQ